MVSMMFSVTIKSSNKVPAVSLPSSARQTSTFSRLHRGTMTMAQTSCASRAPLSLPPQKTATVALLAALSAPLYVAP